MFLSCVWTRSRRCMVSDTSLQLEKIETYWYIGSVFSLANTVGCEYSFSLTFIKSMGCLQQIEEFWVKVKYIFAFYITENGRSSRKKLFWNRRTKTRCKLSDKSQILWRYKFYNTMNFTYQINYRRDAFLLFCHCA